MSQKIEDERPAPTDAEWSAFINRVRITPPAPDRSGPAPTVLPAAAPGPARWLAVEDRDRHVVLQSDGWDGIMRELPRKLRTGKLFIKDGRGVVIATASPTSDGGFRVDVKPKGGAG